MAYPYVLHEILYRASRQWYLVRPLSLGKDGVCHNNYENEPATVSFDVIADSDGGNLAVSYQFVGK